MKYHNNLEDSQIHNAKGFAPARPRSVSAKDSSGSVDWVKCNYTSSVAVTTIADVEGRLHHKYFALYNSNDATKYAVYFDITSVAAFSTPAGYGGVIQVNATATGNNSTAVQLAGYLHTAINGHGDFSSSDDSAGAVGTVTITGMASATHPYDSDNSTSFGFVATDTEVVSEVLTTDASGNMEWITKAALAAATGDMTGVDLTGGTGISIDSETNTTSGDYSATITCNVEGTEVVSTGVTGTTKFLRVDGDNTCSWQVPSYTTNTNTHLISESFRFSTNNLFVGEGLKYTFQGENTTKGGMITVAIDPTAFTSPAACRAMIYIRPDSGTSYTVSQIAGIMTGTSGATVVLRIYKGSPCAGTGFVGTELANGTFALQGSTQHICDDFTILGEGTELLTSHQVLIMTLECSEEIEDLDSRGQITLEIVKVP